MRLDSYESPEHQKYVRTFLNGRFENSAFVLLSPNGQDWLSRASRGPEMVLGRSPSRQMQEVALRYPAKAEIGEAIVQDFHSFRQALNVASADQRVLVLIHAPEDRQDSLRKSLRAVSNDPRVVGRFHFDFDSSDQWRNTVEGARDESGVVLIQPGEFGLKGKVMDCLPLDSSAEKIVTAMVKANHAFANSTEKKVYSQHVAKGRREGIYFEGAVPYGEDRDGDGEVDRRGGPGGRRR